MKMKTFIALVEKRLDQYKNGKIDEYKLIDTIISAGMQTDCSKSSKK